MLSVENLTVTFGKGDRSVRAVDGLSFSLKPQETLGIVGESGCGKSLTALSLLRLLPPGAQAGGSVTFEGENLLSLSDRDIRRVRGKRIAMIFQEPMTALNPVLTVGRQIAETIVMHEGATKAEARERALALLDLVQVPDARRRLGEYPHQLSGGMRQRVMIAIALACDPAILIADEPTTALDVTIQAQILELMLKLKERRSSSIILITHDLGVIAETSQRVIVLYAGKVVEEATVDRLFANPVHPYTRGLLMSLPRLNRNAGDARPRLNEIKGAVPPLDAMPRGCRFAPRCPIAIDVCRTSQPPAELVEPGHAVACWRRDVSGSQHA